MELRRIQQSRSNNRTDTRKDFKFIRPDKTTGTTTKKTLTEKPQISEDPPKRKLEDTKSVSSTTKISVEDRKTSSYQSKSTTVEGEKNTSLRSLKLTVEERNPTNYKPRPSGDRSTFLYRRPESPVETPEKVPENKKPSKNDSWKTVVHTISETLKEEEEEEEEEEEKKEKEKERQKESKEEKRTEVEKKGNFIQQVKEDKKQLKKEEEEEKKKKKEKKETKEEEKKEEIREKTWIKTEKTRELTLFPEDPWILPCEEKLSSSPTFTPNFLEEDVDSELEMPKIAFADQGTGLDWSQRLNYMPHVILIVFLMTGIVFMLASVGSNQWMQAQVSGLTVNYGLFERCVTNPTTDVTICEPFDWPAWLYGTTQEKINAVKVLAIVSLFFCCLFTLGALLLRLTSSCHKCHGWGRKAFVIVVDICLWLMVISAAVSSLLFLSGIHSVEAYPNSVVLWPPVLYCAGWSLCLLSRLIIAACCDVHHEDRNTMPFA